MRFFNDNKTLSIFLISLFVCGFCIHAFPIYILDEAKNSEAAREILKNRSWFFPTFNNELRVDKPPLHYFFMMLGYEVFGVNPWGARFFSSMFGAFTLTTSFHFIRKFTSELLGMLAWGVLLSSVFFIQLFHQAVPDPYLIFFVSCSLFLFFDFFKFQRKSSLWLFYISIALGFLSKGPVAIVLAGLPVFIFLLSRKEITLAKIRKYRPVLGMLIILLITVPWFYFAHIASDGRFTEGFFMGHNVNRFSQKMEGHGGIFLITWAFVILGLLPFSFWIIQSIKLSWENRKEDFVLFALIVCIVCIGFFSISSTKLPNYTMPCYPFLAFIIGNYLHRQWNSQKIDRTFKGSMVALLVVAILLPIGGYIALSVEPQLKGVAWVAFFLIIAPIAIGKALFDLNRGSFKRAVFSLTLGWVLVGFALFGLIYPILARQNPVTLAQEVLNANDKVVAYISMDAAFPVNFKREFEVLESIEEVQLFLEKNPDAYVMSNSKKRKDLLSIHGVKVILEQKALFENHTTLLVQMASENQLQKKE